MAAEAAPKVKMSLDDDMDWGQWFAQNARKVAIAGGGLAVVALGVWWYSVSSSRKETFAAQALDQARASAESGNLPLAASDLARVADRFAGTKAGDQAQILLAQVRLTQGQVDVAVRGLQSFLDARRPEYVLASGYGLLGAGLEQQGKAREAAVAYRQAAEKARLDFLKATYLIDAARALAAAGDTAGARTALGEVLRDYGRLDQAAEARVRMGELGGEVPEPPKDTIPTQ